MSDKNVILTLAKVIIAAAWADGEMTLEEINSLKELLHRLPHAGLDRGTQITGREWAMPEMYIESPVGAAERARLVELLRAALRTPKDRALALSALEDLIQADGVVTSEERAVVEEIKTAIEAVDLGIIGQLGRLIRGTVQRRSQAAANAPNREEYFEDFIKNKVYYAVQQHLNLGEVDLAANESDVQGVTYEVETASGRTIKYTLPCGVPIPQGAVCVCHCVVGGYVPPCTCVGHTAPSCSCVSDIHYWYHC